MLEMITAFQEKAIKDITSKFNPILIGIFGSYARNEQTAESDLDLLVDFQSKINLLDIIGLEQELSEILGIKVDLITARSVNGLLKTYIEKDLIRIL